MTKTTVYLDAKQYLELKRIARRTKQRPAALIRQAVTEFAAQHRSAPVPRSMGAGHSGQEDWASRYEDRLNSFGRE